MRCLLVEDTLAYAARGRDFYYSEEEESEDEEDPDDDDGEDDESWEDESGLRDAAACLLVGAGSAYDPRECQGVAHFLEHLLFMGSEKYPGENDFEEFVAKHGGSENAWTEWESTTFSLEIPQDALWPALDRLAQFFISPLMMQSAVDRELLAIESEFQLSKNSDSSRWQQLLCSTIRREHPMATFSWGNLRSLKEIPAECGVDPMKEIWKFYNRYYYAANMRLVLMGAYSLDVMEEKVVEMFSAVRALPPETDGPFQLPVDPANYASWDLTYRSPIESAGNPFPDEMPKIFRIIPVKEGHNLTITWSMPPLLAHWSSKPADYISHLLGHEAAGSILSYLRSKSWATSCVVSGGDHDGLENASCHSLMTASFVLSEEGLKAWRSVVESVYQYIGMLRLQSRKGWPEYIFEELRVMEDLSYRYGDEPSPDDLVESLVENMAPHLNLPPERVLDGHALLFEFDPSLVQNILDRHLLPSNGRIDLSSSLFGRPTDYPDGTERRGTNTLVGDLQVINEPEVFDSTACGLPQAEPMFGALFWCTEMPKDWLLKLERLAEPRVPSVPLALPLHNPFIPINLSLKQLPDEDSHHPLLNCALKLCIAVGRTKQWFPATVIQYNRKTRSVLMSYEDENEQWHLVDDDFADSPHETIKLNFEGTFDNKSIKFRVVETGGKHAVRRFGDESDYDVDDGTKFPPIPPAYPPHRLPTEICNSNKLKMWWLQDRHYHRPIAELRLQIICRDANKSPLHRTCAELVRALCVDALVETSYLAEVCHLSYHLEATDVGFTVFFDGFDDKLLDLFESVMSILLSFARVSTALPDSISKDRYEACIEVMRRNYKNAGLMASKLCSSIRLRALRKNIWSAAKKLIALDSLSMSLFSKTAASLFESYAVEALYHGNASRLDADRGKKLILDLIESAGGPGLSRKKYPSQTIVRIPNDSAPFRITTPSKDLSEPNTCVDVYFQVAKDNIRDRVLVDLLVHMMEEPLFDQLRTKDQFGYDVSCDIRWTYGIIGLMFHVVTNVKSSDHVVERIDRFLSEYRATILAPMSDSDYLELLVGLAKHKLDMFNSLSEETSAYWSEIRDGRFEWQSWRNEAIFLRSVTKNDVIEAFDTWLLPGQKRKILIVDVIGTGELNSSTGRPQVKADGLEEFIDERISEFHGRCKQQTWGRVNSKLF